MMGEQVVGQVLAIEPETVSQHRIRENYIRAASERFALDMAGWAGRFLVAVKTGREEQVAKSMADAGVSVWIPRTLEERGKPKCRGGRPPKEKDLVRIMAFPGYLVVNIVPSAQSWWGIMSFEHVLGMVSGNCESWADEHPKALLRFALREKVVVDLLRMEMTSHFDFSTEERLFKPNDQVRIKSGPFQGNKGIVAPKRTQSGFFWIEIAGLFGRSALTFMPVDDLEAIN